MTEANTISRADYEILKSILFELETYEAGRRHFPAKVSALGAGINVLMDIESVFREELLDGWRTLEEINALALDSGSLEPLQEHVVQAESTIRRLKTAIRSRLSSRPREDE